MVLNNPARSTIFPATSKRSRFDANAPPWLIQHGDAFLICSDGMWEYVEDEDIVTSLGAASDPQAWLDDLSLRVQAAALAAGNSNHDNYTALGLWFTAPALTQGRGQWPCM